MIKANELRIGNWYNLNGSDFFIDMKMLYAISSGMPQYDLDKINPIPLTEEWLERFGFEKINHIHDGIIYKKDWLRIKTQGISDWRGGSLKQAPKYVHEIQNLYFALTGEELTIKKTAAIS